MSLIDRSDYTIAAESSGTPAAAEAATRSGRIRGYPNPERAPNGIAGDEQAGGELALRRLARLLARIAVDEAMAEASPERADALPDR